MRDRPLHVWLFRRGTCLRAMPLIRSQYFPARLCFGREVSVRQQRLHRWLQARAWARTRQREGYGRLLPPDVVLPEQTREPCQPDAPAELRTRIQVRGTIPDQKPSRQLRRQERELRLCYVTLQPMEPGLNQLLVLRL